MVRVKFKELGLGLRFGPYKAVQHRETIGVTCMVIICSLDRAKTFKDN